MIFFVEYFIEFFSLIVNTIRVYMLDDGFFREVFVIIQTVYFLKGKKHFAPLKFRSFCTSPPKLKKVAR